MSLQRYSKIIVKISIILNFPKKFLVKADIKQLSPKKIEKFWWKLKEFKPYPYSMGGFYPTPGFLGLKSLSNFPIYQACMSKMLSMTLAHTSQLKSEM